MFLGEYRLPLVLAATIIMAYLAVPQSIGLAQRLGAIDKPDERKVHDVTMPRLGGMAIFLAFMLGMFAIGKYIPDFFGVIAGAMIVYTVGTLDDIYQVPPWFKLLGQCLAAAIAIKYGIAVTFLDNPFNGMFELSPFISLPLTFLWLVGVTNAINLLDGLDGLAAGVSGIAAVTMGIIAYMQGFESVFVVAMLLACAIAGFLPFNFHPARTFMGDGGSNFLGFVLASLAVVGMVKSTTFLSLLVPVVILAIPISDTLFAIVRRVYNRQPVMMPDKNHLHHRLMALGFSHPRSVMLIYGGSALFGLLAIAITGLGWTGSIFLVGGVFLVVVVAAEKIGLRTGPRKLGAVDKEESV